MKHAIRPMLFGVREVFFKATNILNRLIHITLACS